MKSIINSHKISLLILLECSSSVPTFYFLQTLTYHKKIFDTSNVFNIPDIFFGPTNPIKLNEHDTDYGNVTIKFKKVIVKIGNIIVIISLISLSQQEINAEKETKEASPIS
ncbi:hypothetical protein RCL_jg23451.t1 [Rhizophagus clarus]|uniref:Uncharacterized protein n=1 Tax=Rhizophagus clarus TaxID=94130 RepID=A0A8H3L6B8_9GLOM|nr:hypothetical protein RCL_jg23451.t1 [Rhizophagus clarus]